MARPLSRFIGLISLTAALTYFIYDGARSFMNQTVQISSVGSTWENIPKSWLAWLQPVIERLGDAWHGDLQPYLLKQPVWLVLAIVGAVLIWAKEEVSARARRREALHNRVGDLEKTVAELKNAVDPPLQKRLKAIERKLEQMPQMRRVA
jgi:hypothetical protein